MDRSIRSKLKDMERVLGKPVRKKRPDQEAEAEANRLVSQRVNQALGARAALWCEMIQTYNAASDKVVRRITVDVLIERLLSSDETIRDRATIWLASIGTQALAGLGLILLGNHSRKMGVAVAQALGQIASLLSERERMFLILKLDMGAYRTGHPEVRCACIEAIVQIRKFNE